MAGTVSTVTDARRLIGQLEGFVSMQEDQKRQIGERIRELRNNSRHTNDSIALAVDVSPRAVGKWIEGKGISRDSAEKVAELFEVEPDWLWSGKERGPTPDVLGALDPTLSDVLDRLTRIESMLSVVMAQVGATQLDAEQASPAHPKRRQSSR